MKFPNLDKIRKTLNNWTGHSIYQKDYSTTFEHEVASIIFHHVLNFYEFYKSAQAHSLFEQSFQSMEWTQEQFLN